MRKVTLLFKDERDLRRFVSIVDCSYLEMNSKELTLTCDCSNEEIGLAQKAFRATVIKEWPTS